MLTKFQQDNASEWVKQLCKRTNGLGRGLQTWHQSITNSARQINWDVKREEPVSGPDKTLIQVAHEHVKAKLEKPGAGEVKNQYAKIFWKEYNPKSKKAAYIKKGSDTLGIRMVMAARGGLMALPKYLVKAKVMTNDKCQECKHLRRRGLREPVEGRTHLIMECQAWASIRKDWNTELEQFFDSKLLKKQYQKVKMMDAEKQALFRLGGELQGAEYIGVNNFRENVALIACKFMGNIFRARAKAAAQRARM